MEHVSTIYARFITRELALNEEQINEVLSHASINAETLFEHNSMPYRDFFAFVIKINKTFSDETLALNVGKKLTPSSLGELGHAILVAPNLLESFTLASNFVFLHAGYMEMRLNADFNGLAIDFLELADLGATRRFQSEVLLLLVQNVIEALTGTPFTRGKFCFKYDTPANAGHYASYFNSPVYFGHANARIEIPKHYLTIRSPFHDPTVWKSYQLRFTAQLHELFLQNKKTYSKHVIDFLNAHPPPLPSAHDTASSLHITERTLNRRLRDESTSYRDIKNSVLRKHALFYLKETNLTVDAIACELGYRDFSSFRRAFKKWTGISPKAYRESHST